ncbi:hypothetical protein [Pontibacter harenae]|nr:hypothetical protein [Pontibacter harenae]MCC9167817.1 hypothetical protein [Pontibacter harenae]
MRHLVGVAVPAGQHEHREGSFSYTVPSGKTSPRGLGAHIANYKTIGL